jgi:hypothetical protein
MLKHIHREYGTQGPILREWSAYRIETEPSIFREGLCEIYQILQAMLHDSILRKVIFCHAYAKIVHAYAPLSDG